MEAMYASGQWHVKEGRADEFVTLWNAWLSWTAENIPGFRTAKLLRSEDDPQRYISVSDWDDNASLKVWKTSPGFLEKFGAVRELCDAFTGGDHELMVAVEAPALRS